MVGALQVVLRVALAYTVPQLCECRTCTHTHHTPHTPPPTHARRQQHQWVWYSVPPNHRALSDLSIHGPGPGPASPHPTSQPPSPSHQFNARYTTWPTGATKPSQSSRDGPCYRHCRVRDIRLCMCYHFVFISLSFAIHKHYHNRYYCQADKINDVTYSN